MQPQENDQGPAGSSRPVSGQPPFDPQLIYPSGRSIPPTIEPSSSVDGQPAAAPLPIQNSAGGRLGRLKNKKFLVAALSVFIVLIGAGLVFGWYLPNRPENVWRTGLSRTSGAVDKLVTDFTKEDNLQAISRSELTGTVDVTTADSSYSVNINSKYDKKHSGTTVKAKYKTGNGPEKNISFNMLTDLPDGHYMPDVYLKLTGIRVLGLDQFFPGLAKYDGKWISASSDYLQSLIPNEGQADEEPFNHQDTTELSKIIVSTTSEYVLNPDSEKAVLVMKKFIGKEKVGDITANRYQVAINDANAKKYCQALVDSLLSSSAYKKLMGSDSSYLEQERMSSTKTCEEYLYGEDAKDDTFDIWIDKKYKLLHKLRISDPDNANSYIEFGQNYRGGDVIPLFANFHDDKRKTDVKLTFDINTKSSAIIVTFDYQLPGSEGYQIKGTFELKPHNQKLTVKKPAGAIPLQEVLKNLGFGEFTTPKPSGVNPVADSERKTDIKALQGQLEVYWANNGYYPSLSQMNDLSFRSANFVGTNDDVFTDPDGPSNLLAASPTKNRYSYQASGCDSSGVECSAFKLTATLSDSQYFTVSSLN